MRALAEKHGLFDKTRFNGHLKFTLGDISYWHEQELPAWDLEIEFIARRMILDAADKAEARFDSAGSLGSVIGKLYAVLLSRAKEKWSE